ncbi:MAG: tyrosine-type recombinase/integrase [Alphaproteobacteria bacterium]|nr:tyrosine-type recombinase/integrase [Alphaproteobacteria bacterium]
MKPPLPVFDSLEFIDKTNLDVQISNNENRNDYQKALEFLKSYKGSQGTFNAYRREIERLLHWCTLIAKKSLKELKRQNMEDFIHFCQKPPKSWIGVNKLPRFIEKGEERFPNPEWRPFVVTVSKSGHRQGERPNLQNFELSQSALKDTFAILGSFYTYLLQEEYVYMNPVALIRQKSKFLRKNQGPPKIRRLSERQWQYVIKTAEEMAVTDPTLHERTLFIMSALYSMYLRISELAASKRWSPTMNHFFRDSEEGWWFTTVGKGNKQRQIAVSNAMLEALKRWREHLGLSTLPSPADKSPLLPKTKGQGPMSSTNHIRKIVQGCFDQAINNLQQDNYNEEAESLTEATVHWLRHTGISDDVKRRPREHVRDDAGHGSGAITDKYIDIELKERNRSAKNKPIASN